MKGTTSTCYFRARIQFLGEVLELPLLHLLQKGYFLILGITNIALVITITILDVIDSPVIYLKHDISETLDSISIFKWNKPTQIGSTERASCHQ
jgi:hypothetical protein